MGFGGCCWGGGEEGEKSDGDEGSGDGEEMHGYCCGWRGGNWWLIVEEDCIGGKLKAGLAGHV